MVVIVVSLIALLVAIFILRSTRIKHKNPKYIPTLYLKRLWQRWDPSPIHNRLPDTNDHLEPISTRASIPPPTNAAPAAAAGVDRNTSVRSVMTLPAYHPSAGQNEQVLGREGERGGIDVVIEFPETVDEEEQLREAEMEALYQVRLARRRENEEREERRRLRREARERGDYNALREIAERQRASSTASAGQTIEELRAEHDRLKKERQRAVSSVSYADLGVARHDGTRLRANSQDSERQGLLGDAASIAASSHYHRRDRSASSILSVDSDLPSLGLTRSRTNSRAASPSSRRRSGQSQVETNDRAGSSPEMIEHEDLPPNSPPGYENISLDTPQDEHPTPLEPPPEYQSPVVGRGERSDPLPEGRQSSSRRSHVGQLMSDRRASSSNSSASRTSERRTSRGGIPQLPSLRLASLPSIQVDPGSPRSRAAVTDERDVTEQRLTRTEE